MATGGVMHLCFWDIKNGNMTAKNAKWAEESMQSITAIAHCRTQDGNWCLTGTSTGSLYVWNGTELRLNKCKR
jgi:hypothetical protein